jgi:hypothetical protein
MSYSPHRHFPGASYGDGQAQSNASSQGKVKPFMVAAPFLLIASTMR